MGEQTVKRCARPLRARPAKAKEVTAVYGISTREQMGARQKFWNVQVVRFYRDPYGCSHKLSTSRWLLGSAALARKPAV